MVSIIHYHDFKTYLFNNYSIDIRYMLGALKALNIDMIEDKDMMALRVYESYEISSKNTAIS